MVPPSSPPCSSPTTSRCCCFVVLVVVATLAFVLACILVAHLSSPALHHTTQHNALAIMPTPIVAMLLIALIITNTNNHPAAGGVDCGWWQCNGVGCHYAMACTHHTTEQPNVVHITNTLNHTPLHNQLFTPQCRQLVTNTGLWCVVVMPTQPHRECSLVVVVGADCPKTCETRC